VKAVQLAGSATAARKKSRREGIDPPPGKRLNKPTGKSRDIVSRFSRCTKIESVVGIILLASVAFLVNTGLPQSEFQNQFRQQESSSGVTSSVTGVESFKATDFIDNDTRVVLSITPFAVGSNNFSISFVLIAYSNPG